MYELIRDSPPPLLPVLLLKATLSSKYRFASIASKPVLLFLVKVQFDIVASILSRYTVENRMTTKVMDPIGVTNYRRFHIFEECSCY